MRPTKPVTTQPNDLRKTNEALKPTAESKIRTVVGDMHISDERWRESQVEEPERWDGMS